MNVVLLQLLYSWWHLLIGVNRTRVYCSIAIKVSYHVQFGPAALDQRNDSSPQQQRSVATEAALVQFHGTIVRHLLKIDATNSL